MFVKSSRGTRVANNSGSGYQARRLQCETLRATTPLCVCCVRCGIRRSGGIVRGRLWRPYRPFQVIGVLAAVLPIARKSQQFSRSAECAGKLPTPAQVNLAKSGERLHANTAPIPWAASNASQCSTKPPRGSYRTNSSCCDQRSQRLEEVDGFFVRSELESMGGDHEFSDTPR